MNVKYIGAARDYSGYGEAARHDIASLLHAGIGVTIDAPHYTLETADYGTLAEYIYPYQNIPLEYDIILIHTTPNVVGQYHEKGKYHIARVFWETDKLPADFAKPLQQYADEIWTGSEFNKQAIIKAGVKKPIYIIPQAIDTSLDIFSIHPYITRVDNTFKFYSIFEWTERKNPTALLEAYWNAFSKDDPVSLTIKTYVDNHTPEKRQEIRERIENLKLFLNLDEIPQTYIYIQLLNRYEMYRFHKSFDCFVSTHRGEGWGLPQMEALLMGNPIISTGCGGIHEYVTKENGALLLPYSLNQINGNTRNQFWYTFDQQWAYVNSEDIKTAMKRIYSMEKHKRIVYGQRGRNDIQKLFSFDAVGTQMKARIEAIYRERSS